MQFSNFESIRTGSGNDNIIGTASNNVIDSGGGADAVFGLEGSDTITYYQLETADGGDDNDLLDGKNDTAGITLNLGTSTQFSHFENIITGSGNDKIIGTLGNNAITTGIGNDIIDGLGGNDTIIGGAGNDTISYYQLEIADGGDGTDILDANADVDGLTINLATSNQFTGFEDILTGIGNDYISGTAGSNIINSGGGKDTVCGGGGNDTITYYASESADGGDGIDLLDAKADTDGITLDLLASTKFAGFENILTGTGNDYISGTDGSNVINSGGGEDTIFGGGGDDTIAYYASERANGGEGTDLLDASADTAGITLNLTTSTQFIGFENIVTGSGNDNIIGTAGADIISTNAGDDIIDGGSGADSLLGGAGNDTYTIDNISDIVIENDNEGIDTIYSTVDYYMGDYVENLILTGINNIQGIGNNQDNVITGNKANNKLEGGLGADTLIGGAGNDKYVVYNIGDVVVEKTGEGTDAVLANIDYTLGINVENLTLLNTDNLSGTGNALSNSIYGNFGNNVLNGGAGDDVIDGDLGADTMIGGTGNDTFKINDIGDIIIENAGEGKDTVNSSLETYTLCDNMENLVLSGTKSVSGIGNELDNTITGNFSNNYLYGYAGNDTLSGGNGDDYLEGGLGNDTYIYGTNCKNDIVNNYIEGQNHGVDTIWMQNVKISSMSFTQNQNDLVCSITNLSTPTTITVSNWFLGTEYQVDQFKFTDGNLTASQIGLKIS